MENLAALVNKESVLRALERAIEENLPLRKATKFWIKYKGKTFPPKEIVRLAAREQGIKNISDKFYSLKGGKPTNSYLQRMGFEIIQIKDWEVSCPTDNRNFQFKAGSATKNLVDRYYLRKEVLIQSKSIHDQIQKVLFKYLVDRFGSDNVSMEADAGDNNRIDIVLKQGSVFSFYEVKSFDEARISIRFAIGQLIEYGYYPNPVTNLNELIIVSHKPLTKKDEKYLSTIRKQTNLKLFYQFVDLATNEVSAYK